MHDQAQAWSDRQEPVMEDVPAQRPPAQEQPDGTEPDGTWVPADDRAVTDRERGASDEDRAASDEDRAASDEDRAVENEDRAVGVAPVPDRGAVGDDEAVRDDEAAREEAAADDEAVRSGAADGTAVDDEVRDHAALHDAAHEGPDEPLAGGVPEDAVSSHDAPVPAAAYDTTEPAGTSTADADAADRDLADAQVADSAAAGTGAGDATDAELLPGQVPQEPVSALFDPGTAGDFRDRWQRVQMQFVDDPRGAAEQARSLVDDVVSALQASLTNQRGSLDGWQSGQAGDTEELRVAVRRYRDFLDRILGL